MVQRLLQSERQQVALLKKKVSSLEEQLAATKGGAVGALAGAPEVEAMEE